MPNIAVALKVPRIKIALLTQQNYHCLITELTSHHFLHNRIAIWRLPFLFKKLYMHLLLHNANEHCVSGNGHKKQRSLISSLPLKLFNRAYFKTCLSWDIWRQSIHIPPSFFVFAFLNTLRERWPLIRKWTSAECFYRQEGRLFAKFLQNLKKCERRRGDEIYAHKRDNFCSKAPCSEI